METPKGQRRSPRNNQRVKGDERRTQPSSRDNSPGRGRRNTLDAESSIEARSSING